MKKEKHLDHSNEECKQDFEKEVEHIKDILRISAMLGGFE